jgi:hypothetical protein
MSEEEKNVVTVAPKDELPPEFEELREKIKTEDCDFLSVTLDVYLKSNGLDWVAETLQDGLQRKVSARGKMPESVLLARTGKYWERWMHEQIASGGENFKKKGLVSRVGIKPFSHPERYLWSPLGWFRFTHAEVTRIFLRILAQLYPDMSRIEDVTLPVPESRVPDVRREAAAFFAKNDAAGYARHLFREVCAVAEQDGYEMCRRLWGCLPASVKEEFNALRKRYYELSDMFHDARNDKEKLKKIPEDFFNIRDNLNTLWNRVLRDETPHLPLLSLLKPKLDSEDLNHAFKILLREFSEKEQTKHIIIDKVKPESTYDMVKWGGAADGLRSFFDAAIFRLLEPQTINPFYDPPWSVGIVRVWDTFGDGLARPGINPDDDPAQWWCEPFRRFRDFAKVFAAGNDAEYAFFEAVTGECWKMLGEYHKKALSSPETKRVLDCFVRSWGMGGREFLRKGEVEGFLREERFANGTEPSECFLRDKDKKERGDHIYATSISREDHFGAPLSAFPLAYAVTQALLLAGRDPLRVFDLCPPGDEKTHPLTVWARCSELSTRVTDMLAVEMQERCALRGESAAPFLERLFECATSYIRKAPFDIRHAWPESCLSVHLPEAPIGNKDITPGLMRWLSHFKSTVFDRAMLFDDGETARLLSEPNTPRLPVEFRMASAGNYHDYPYAGGGYSHALMEHGRCELSDFMRAAQFYIAQSFCTAPVPVDCFFPSPSDGSAYSYYTPNLELETGNRLPIVRRVLPPKRRLSPRGIVMELGPKEYVRRNLPQHCYRYSNGNIISPNEKETKTILRFAQMLHPLTIGRSAVHWTNVIIKGPEGDKTDFTQMYGRYYSHKVVKLYKKLTQPYFGSRLIDDTKFPPTEYGAMPPRATQCILNGAVRCYDALREIGSHWDYPIGTRDQEKFYWHRIGSSKDTYDEDWTDMPAWRVRNFRLESWNFDVETYSLRTGGMAPLIAGNDVLLREVLHTRIVEENGEKDPYRAAVAVLCGTSEMLLVLSLLYEGEFFPLTSADTAYLPEDFNKVLATVQEMPQWTTLLTVLTDRARRTGVLDEREIVEKSKDLLVRALWASRQIIMSKSMRDYRFRFMEKLGQLALHMHAFNPQHIGLPMTSSPPSYSEWLELFQFTSLTSKEVRDFMTDMTLVLGNGMADVALPSSGMESGVWYPLRSSLWSKAELDMIRNEKYLASDGRPLPLWNATTTFVTMLHSAFSGRFMMLTRDFFDRCKEIGLYPRHLELPLPVQKTRGPSPNDAPWARSFITKNTPSQQATPPQQETRNERGGR